MKIRRKFSKTIKITHEDSTFIFEGLKPNLVYDLQPKFKVFYELQNSDKSVHTEVESVPMLCHIFKEFLVSWTNLEDEDGNVLDCDLENKEAVCQAELGLVIDVTSKALNKVRADQEEDSKN